MLLVIDSCVIHRVWSVTSILRLYKINLSHSTEVLLASSLFHQCQIANDIKCLLFLCFGLYKLYISSSHVCIVNSMYIFYIKICFSQLARNKNLQNNVQLTHLDYQEARVCSFNPVGLAKGFPHWGITYCASLTHFALGLI